jgi:large subunit ribosomal protein L6
MSRLAKKPIEVSNNVEVKLDQQMLTVKGPKGTLTLEITKGIVLDQSDKSKLFVNATDELKQKPFHGLMYSLINNMVIGVTQGFQKNLEMIGVGYKAAVKGRVLDIAVGFSHPTLIDIPEGIEIKVEKNTKLNISGIDKQMVGQIAALIRSKRPPEPYKGKGIKYADEHVRRKAGKSAGKGA